MRHRAHVSPSGRARRWVAALSVAVMLASAAVLAGVLLDRVLLDRVLLDRVLLDPATPAVEVRPPGSRVAGRYPRPAAEERPRRDVQPREASGDGWRAVLADLDRQRSRAYAAADPRLLREVYTPGSRALRRDRDLLLRYRRRGLRVLGLRMRVVDLRARASDRDRVVLRVRDRVVARTVVGPDGRHRLPPDGLDASAVTLRRVGGDGWRISTVRPAGVSAAP